MSDVAQEFGISPQLARYHLQKAVKSGQIMLADGRFHVKSLGEGFKLARPAHQVRITSAKFSLRNRSASPRTNVSLQNKSPTASKTSLHRLSSNSVNRLTGHLTRRSKQRNVFETLEKEVWWRKPKHLKGKPPSHYTLQSLYSELLARRLTLPEITGTFNLSKRSVKSLVKKGLLEEEWGEGGIGVRYRLSEIGVRQLSAMQEASRFSVHGKQAFIPLKNRSAI